ncbi:PH domain-containing protein [Chryseobacterium sp. 2987]|uniref:PH domain-containing protein n=1 Tax=Chryseobacterium sp. 2987 TaxID=2817767 RepID=UPI00285CE8BC|nr:PH domain-containing protein [Chryseobacterium sp. 2987]MDR6923581.1 hypothetical protein [Chryseobacterium sp. 2987]
MNTECALCGTLLTSMDTLLGENKLSDGGILCNKCLNKVTNINKDLVYDLINYNVIQIKEIFQNSNIEEEKYNELKTTELKKEIPLVAPISQSVQFDFSPEEPTRLDDIKDEIAALNPVLTALTDSEVNELANILDEDEKVVAIVEGTYEYNNLKGILLATQKKIMFIDKSIFGEIFKNKFPFTKITFMQHDTNLMSSGLKVFTSGFIAEFTLYSRSAAKKFYESVEPYLIRPGSHSEKIVEKPQPQQEPVKKEAPEIIFDQLEKLGKLRETGILTEQEFAEQKKKLLAKL